MVKKILFFIIPILLVAIYGFKPHDQPRNTNGQFRNSNPNQTMVISSSQLDANQISTWFRTNGSFNRDPSTGNAGFIWPNGSGKTARYASGLWLGCVVGSDTLTAVAEYSYDYVNGYVDDQGNPQGSDDPLYRIYKITQGNTTSEDYVNWPANQGAYTDSLGKPLNLGTQTMFYVYTDAYPHGSGSTSLQSLKAQILQTNWAYNVNGPLGNIIFQEYRVINRSTNVWTKTYMAQWTDDDLGSLTDDKVGVDTSLDLGYTYNATNSDGVYGTAPPAVGFDFFRGAVVASSGDTVKYYSPPGSTNLVVKPNFRDMGLTVFNFYNNTNPIPSDPLNNTETYRVLEGKWKTNDSWVTPGGDTTRKCYTGDPVTNTGWIMPGEGDRRFIQCTGPFVMNPGDTQIIVVAQVIARGSSNLGSITTLKSTDALAQRIFDNNFQVPASAPVVPTQVYAPGTGIIYLSWSDTAEKTSIPNKLSGGSYKFQGYNIYQIKPGTNGSNEADRVLMATYDLKDGVGDIQDSVFSTAYGVFIYYTVQKGANTGISRYFVMNRDYINNSGLYNGTTYQTVVTAYFYDSLGGPFSAPKVNETPITSTNVIKTIPQNLTAGTTVNYNVGDTISTSEMDLGTLPLVIEPLSLVSASYTTTYGGTLAAPTWSLTKTYQGKTSTLYTNNPDFSGTQDTAETIDGFLLLHQSIKDSGIILDQNDPVALTNNKPTYARPGCWTYTPSNGQWFTGPDTTAIKTAKIITNRQFQSRSLGISFPTSTTFRGTVTRIKANGSQFTQTGTSPILSGGPLRKIKLVFGQTSQAYRYGTNTNVLLTDTNLTNTPYQSMVSIPFSAYAVDDLDSTNGTPRQLNVGFVDADNSGTWDPDPTKLGGYEFTYILASNYDATPNTNYTTKNPGIGGGANGFTNMDIMYAWLPRVKTVNNAPLSWNNGDELYISPYIITKPNFVPGYPIEYSWSINGTVVGNSTLASSQLSQVKAFPNPYYGTNPLEADPFNRFIYINHLPSVCNIYIYSLDGLLVNKISRNNTDPNNSLEQWNLQNFNQIPVASGMYIIYVDAGSLGSTTLKVAIFTPEERISTF